jgi:hypothetical protein
MNGHPAPVEIDGEGRPQGGRRLKDKGGNESFMFVFELGS